MVRLVFRPLTHVRRTICTSVSLQSSTRVSSGFNLRTLSSPSFGSHHICSGSIVTCVTSADAASLRIGTVHFHFARGFSTQILANIIVSLVRVSRRVILSHFVNMPNTLMASTSPSDSKVHTASRHTPSASRVRRLPRRGTCFAFHSPGRRMQRRTITVIPCGTTHLSYAFLRRRRTDIDTQNSKVPPLS